MSVWTALFTLYLELHHYCRSPFILEGLKRTFYCNFTQLLSGWGRVVQNQILLLYYIWVADIKTKSFCCCWCLIEFCVSRFSAVVLKGVRSKHVLSIYSVSCLFVWGCICLCACDMDWHRSRSHIDCALIVRHKGDKLTLCKTLAVKDYLQGYKCGVMMAGMHDNIGMTDIRTFCQCPWPIKSFGGIQTYSSRMRITFVFEG